jgi:opacity protein-like surface antigen
MKALIAALIASTVAISAHAEGPYIGLGISSTDHEFPDLPLSGLPGSVKPRDADGYQHSPKVFGGYDFTSSLGVEAGYTDLRKAKATYGPGVHAAADGRRAYVAGKFTAPLNERLFAFGKLGLGYKKAKYVSGGLTGSYQDNATGLYAGAGAQYTLNAQVALSVEYERYSKKNDYGAKPDAITVGVRCSFQ